VYGIWGFRFRALSEYSVPAGNAGRRGGYRRLFSASIGVGYSTASIVLAPMVILIAS
jgi:hypothetical protein